METEARDFEQGPHSPTETVSNINYRLDSEGNIVFVSDGVREYGYSAGELIGTSIFQLVHPEDREKAAYRINERRTGSRSTKSLAVRLLTRENPVESIETSSTTAENDRVFLITAEGLYDFERPETKSYIGTQGIAIEFTGEKSSVGRIGRQAEFLHLVLESLPHPFYVIDTCDYTIRLANSTAHSGRLPKDATCYALTHKVDKPCRSAEYPCPVEEIKKTKQPLLVEHIHYDKNGNPRNYEVYAHPVFDSEGNVTQIIEHALDITERKRTEEALRASQQELTIRNRIAHIFLTTHDEDMFGEVLKIVLDSVESTYGVFGYIDENEALRCASMTKGPSGKCQVPNKDILFPHDKWEGLWGLTFREKKMFWRNEPLPVPEGHIFIARALSIPIIHHGKPFGNLTVANKNRDYDERDLNLLQIIADYVAPVLHARSQRDRKERERVKLKEQFRHAQKMEAIGTLAGGIAHDFNNLLMAIQGNTSLMLLNVDPDSEHYERLKHIEQSAQSGAQLTKQLLGFARGGKYEAKPTDLNELIKRQNRIFGRAKKEITVRGKYEEDLWTVEVDQGQIEQVLLNLYVNAADAMHHGGGLFIHTANVTLSREDIRHFHFPVLPGNYTKVSVTDTGIGMDEATQQRIFEPFFTTKEMGLGTGLGLASAYGIIKNHGGIINVSSQSGEGATFNIYLPASDKEIQEETVLTGKVLKGEETLLLVDDEEIIIQVGEEILEALGYKVMIARGGKEAIECYKKHNDQIDLVILDMIMPEIGGGETYERIKKMNPAIKVLLSSGYSINGQAEVIMERGCNGFIQKPFKIREISQKIREILDKQ